MAKSLVSGFLTHGVYSSGDMLADRQTSEQRKSDTFITILRHPDRGRVQIKAVINVKNRRSENKTENDKTAEARFLSTMKRFRT